MSPSRSFTPLLPSLPTSFVMLRGVGHGETRITFTSISVQLAGADPVATMCWRDKVLIVMREKGLLRCFLADAVWSASCRCPAGVTLSAACRCGADKQDTEDDYLWACALIESLQRKHQESFRVRTCLLCGLSVCLMSPPERRCLAVLVQKYRLDVSCALLPAPLVRTVHIGNQDGPTRNCSIVIRPWCTLLRCTSLCTGNRPLGLCPC